MVVSKARSVFCLAESAERYVCRCRARLRAPWILGWKNKCCPQSADHKYYWFIVTAEWRTQRPAFAISFPDAVVVVGQVAHFNLTPEASLCRRFYFLPFVLSKGWRAQVETCGQIACSVGRLPIRFTVGTGGTIRMRAQAARSFFCRAESASVADSAEWVLAQRGGEPW